MDATTVNSENAGFLLDDFLKSLEGKDFSIDIDDYVVANQINDLLLNKDLTIDQTKYSLAAIICRNGEEQQKFYQLFEDHIEKNIQEAELIKIQEAESIKKIKNRFKRKKLILFTFISLVILLLLFSFLYVIPISKTNQYIGEEKPINTSGHYTTNNTVHFSILNEPISGYLHTDKKWDPKQTIYQSQFEPSYDTTGLKVEWNLQDTIIKNKKNIQYRFKSPGKKNIAIRFIYGNTIKRTHKDSIFICEPPPNIKVPDTIFVNEKATFTAVSAKDISLIWTLDGLDTITKSNVLEHTFTESGNHNISCKIQGQLCTHDNESKAINTKSFDVMDKEVFTVNKTPDTPYISKYSTSLSQFFYWLLGIALLFLLCCLITLFVPYIYSLYEKIMRNYFNAANRKKAEKYFKDSTELIFSGDKPPIDIRFYNKDRLIKSKQNIRKLSFDLQRKVATEDSKINLIHTIKASIQNFDLLTPVYENKNAKRCYLFLIDVSNPKNTQIKLFAFLINHLKKSQVDLDIYYYFRDPIRVFKREVDDSIDIKTLKDKYYQSVLIVFSDGYNFLDANAPEIYVPIRKEYSYWTKRILVTPMPSLDWSINEKILASFFHVVAADSSGLLGIFPMLEKGVYNQKIVNTKDFNTYECKFIEFEDIKSLKGFLVNKEMFQWVCAIAVYPKITWEIILTIGETINPSIVTYENLLKISRIKWVQNGIFPTRIRLELLKKLDRNYEVEARKVIIKLLEEESKKDDSSFSNNERSIQLIFNKFILFSYNPKTFALYEKEEKEFLRLYQDEKFRDIPTKIYLQGVDPDKKDSWKSLMKESSNESVDNLEHYYNSKTNTIPQHLISKSIKKYLRAVSLFFLVIVSALTFIGFTKPNSMNLFMVTTELKPYLNVCNINLNVDECYRAFNPVKLIISDNNGKIIHNSTLTEKDSIIPLKSIFGKEISLQFISYKNDTISSIIKVQQLTSIVHISGVYCKRINAEFYGKNYELYKDILETKPLQTKNFASPQIANSVIFKPDIDSTVIYKLCLDLIKKKFPLQEISKTENFTKSEVENKNTKILFARSETKNNIITTEDELNFIFYKKSTKYPVLGILYFPESSINAAKKLENEIKKNGMKFSNILLGPEELLYDDGFQFINEGIFFSNGNSEKSNKTYADKLSQIASNVLGHKLKLRSTLENKYLSRDVIYVSILKWSMLINKTNDSNVLYKILSGIGDYKVVLNNDSKNKNDINYMYYNDKTTKGEAIELAKSIMKHDINLKVIIYKPKIKYNVEFGYNNIYDDCPILTESNLMYQEIGCHKEACKSGLVDTYKYLIYFESDKMNIPTDGALYLKKVLDHLNQYPYFTATINSYSNEGSEKYNMSLSERRAQSTAEWLIKNGINSRRIKPIGNGNAGYNGQNCFDRIEIVIEADETVTTTKNPNLKDENVINVPSGSNYTQKGQYLYYGDYNGGKWSELYFKNKQNDFKLPEVGDEIISTNTVNIREQVIQNINGSWINQKSLGILQKNTTVKITKVITLAGGNFIWVEYELSPQKGEKQNKNNKENIYEQNQQPFNTNDSIRDVPTINMQPKKATKKTSKKK